MGDVTAGCSCGALRVTATGEPDRVGVCHCLECRRHHGALFYAAAIFDAAAVSVKGQTVAYAGRHVCAVCGASVFARSGAEIELHLGALDRSDRFVPTYECWTSRREHWLVPIPGAQQFPKDRDSGSGE